MIKTQIHSGFSDKYLIINGKYWRTFIVLFSTIYALRHFGLGPH